MLERLKTFGGAARAAAARLACDRRASTLLCGLALGIAAWSAAHPFVATFGFNRESIAALIVAAGGCFAVGARLAARGSRFDAFGLPALTAAGWLVLLPSILVAAEAVVTVAPVASLSIAAVRLPLLGCAALIAIGVPSLCAGIVTSRFRAAGQGVTLLFAAAAGVATNSLILAPTIGLHAPLLCVAVGAAAVWFVALVSGTAEIPSARVVEPTTRTSDSVRAVGSVVLAAGLAGISARVAAQLSPESGYAIAAAIAAGLVGLGCGMLLSSRLRRVCSPDGSRCCGAALAAIAALLPLAAFPWLIGRQLDANAYVSSVFWLMTIRAGFAAAVSLGIGIGCGLMTGSSTSRVGSIALAAAVGLAAPAWLIPAVGLAAVALALSSGLLLLNAGPTRSTLPRTWRGRALTAVGGIALVAVALNTGRYAPGTSARLLFSTEGFIAHRNAVPTELLPYLDDTRLAAVSESAGGTVTLWKHRGDALLVRLDGVPVAATSTRPDRCPPPTADVLRVTLPLVLHDSPESLLLLGDPAGLAASTAVAFPLRAIVCYDPIDGVRSAASRFVPPVEDDRLLRSSIEPRLAVAAERGLFDVVVSDPGTPSLPAAAPYLTREFYSRAAARLTSDGIFCQRLRYADFGPNPLRSLAATVRGLFGDTMLLEVGAGEYVLLGTPIGSKLIREGLAARIQLPQVRRTLAGLGWDWCVPLNLAALDAEGLNRLAGEGPGRNTSSNGWFAHTLPQEVMRWGLKSQELRQATAGLTTRLLDRGVPESEQRDVLDRIAEVTGQHRLMTEYPDQPWAYRKEVRNRLKETPRSVIQPVAGEVQRVMHPDDRRRLDYFAALGEAAKSPDTETLQHLERFAEPYDPMLTYFLHHEAAPLYARLGSAGQAAEFAHRLHAAHFADLRDRSVRNEIAATELLVANPELVPDEAERFDHLNALIEVLLGRWEARGMAQPKSPEVVMVDIDKTLDATEAAVDAMAPLAAAAGLSDDQWQLRLAAIDRTLTRPLRTYRTSLLPHVRKAQREAAVAEK